MNETGKRRVSPTISQVASAALVARSTVSRAFSNPQMLKQETVDRVMAVARDIGYVPNHTARALSTGRYANIALIAPDVANPFFPPLIRAAQQQADSADFCVFLGNSNEDPRQEDKLLDRFAGQVEGVILVSSRLSEERIRSNAARLPLILVNRDVKGIARVLIDSGIGVEQAVRHLAGLGHRRLTYLAGPRQSWSNRQRQATVKRLSKELGLTVFVLQPRTPTLVGEPGLLDTIITSHSSAVIAFDDLMAQGLIALAGQRGIAVPEALSVIGCDDVLGAVTYPALTTVSNRSAEAGTIAIALLFERLKSGSAADVRYVLDTHFVLRNTTAEVSRS